jgi:uncharacterized membrane protein
MTFSSPFALLLLPILLVGSVWVWTIGHRSRATPRRIAALCLRIAIFMLLVLAAAGMTIDRPHNAQAVAFVADLSVSTQPAQPGIVRAINEALRARGAGDLAALVAMGRTASVERPPAALTTLQRFEAVVDPEFTNIEAGLSLGGALLPSSYRRRVVLLSDGRENIGDAAGEAQVLHQQGIRVDVIPVSVQSGPEVRVDSLTAPQNMRLGDRFTLLAQVASTIRTTTRYDIIEDSHLVGHGTADLGVGESTISAQFYAESPGQHTFSITLQPQTDTLTENNQASAFIEVGGKPLVLVVEGTPGDGANVLASLRASGMRTETVAAQALTSDLAVLQQYDAIVLVDVSADVLGVDTMVSLKSYVSDLGRGLVTIGGLNSYGLGNYGSSPLEDALPLSMDLPKRKDLPRAAVVLIIEDLESQIGVDISKRAGEGVVGFLNPNDLVAVSDATPNLVWPLSRVTDKAAVIHAIDTMQPQDPPSYELFLAQAFALLRSANVQTKQIILLGDGDAANDSTALLKKISAAGIQVSTIETNASDAGDFQNMRDIAAHGGGKYYTADDVTNIPQVFLKVARTVSHDGIVESKFVPHSDATSPILAGIDPAVPLSGYVITTPKLLATVVLSSDKSDPILAQWQYGLGRSVAWTSDALGRWTSQWLASPGTRNIWSAMVHWVLPPPRSTELALSASVSGGQIHIGVDNSGSAEYKSVTAHVVGPNFSAAVALEPEAPNHYSASFNAGTAGAYHIAVQAVSAPAGGKGPISRSVTGGVVVPYATDYRDNGVDMPGLVAIAAAGGGAVIARPDAAFADNLASAAVPTPLQTPLLLWALLLLPVDVGLRRLVLTRADVAVILRSLNTKRRLNTDPVLASAPLARVRERRATARPRPANQQDALPPVSPIGFGEAPKHRPSDGSSSHARMPAALESVDADTPAPTDHSEAPDSVASRLLEAKRRRAKR